jgi:hypothetical protein
VKRHILFWMIVVVLAGCGAQEEISGSSVRFLRGAKHGLTCGNQYLLGKPTVTAYIGDALYNKRRYEKQNSFPEVKYVAKADYGLRVETYRRRKALGIDYSENRITSYYPAMMSTQSSTAKQTQFQYRVNLSFNYFYILRMRTMFYAGVQTGFEFTRRNVWIENIETYIWQDNYSPAVNARVCTGVYFRITRSLRLNLEAGYGGGAFIKSGVSLWSF